MTQKLMRYQLATAANYRFEIVKMGQYNYDPVAYYYKEDFPDVKVTRPGTDTDLELIHNNYLVTVNGYVHNTAFSNGDLFIPKATISMLKSRSNVIGILSMSELSTNITKTKITEDMVSFETNIPPVEKVILNFPEEIIRPVLIMSGYMIFENPEFFYRTSDRAFVVRLDRLNYIEKLYELQRQRDIFYELGIPVSPNNPSMIDGSIAKSDIAIKKFMSSYNSFIVDLNINDLETQKVYLEHSNIPGTFRTEVYPNLPMFVGYGKIGEYNSKRQVEGKHIVIGHDCYYNNHIFSYQNQATIDIYNDHRKPGDTYRLSQAFFLNVSTT